MKEEQGDGITAVRAMMDKKQRHWFRVILVRCVDSRREHGKAMRVLRMLKI